MSESGARLLSLTGATAVAYRFHGVGCDKLVELSAKFRVAGFASVNLEAFARRRTKSNLAQSTTPLGSKSQFELCTGRRSWQAAPRNKHVPGGASCELLWAAGKDPARTYGAKLKGAVRRTYDQKREGIVGASRRRLLTRLALGDASSHTSIKGGLGLHMRYVALQVKLPPGRSQRRQLRQ